MKLLILGRTNFFGRNLVETALARCDEITLVNRGQTNSELYSEVEKTSGDRDGSLAALGNRSWDAVIDPSGYVPRLVGASAEALRDRVQHYTFISSCSVYADATKPGVNENDPVGKIADESVE